MKIGLQFNNNLTFGKTSIYAVNVNGGQEAVRKFESIAQASRELDVSKRSISAVLDGANHVTSNYFFYYADDLERGQSQKEINRKLINSVPSQLDNAYSQPIYALCLNGEYRRFNSPKEASQELDVPYSKISRSLRQGEKGAICNNFTFVKASNVERRDVNGVPILSVKELNQQRERFLKAATCPIVVITESMEIEIFPSQKEVEDKFNIMSSNLSHAINHGPKAYKGRVYVRLEDVVARNKKKELIFDENNDFVLDELKIKQVYFQGFYAKSLKPLR